MLGAVLSEWAARGLGHTRPVWPSLFSAGCGLTFTTGRWDQA